MFTAVLVFILFRVAQDNKGFDDEEEGMKRWTFFCQNYYKRSGQDSLMTPEK